MELTDTNYETLIKQNEKPVFIDFYSPTCGPCQILSKFIDERLEAYGNKNGIKVVKCNVSQNPKLASAFKINSVPFTIAVMPGGKLKYPELGLKEESYYFNTIDKLAGKRSLLSRLFG